MLIDGGTLPGKVITFRRENLTGEVPHHLFIKNLRMKEIKLKAVRLWELSTVIDSIGLKELGDLKSIRMASNIVKDLQTACKEYGEMMSDLQAKQLVLLKPYQEMIADEGKDMNAEDKQKLVDKANAEYQAEANEKLSKDFEKANKLGEKEVICELSDEKFVKLQELFEKHGVNSYKSKQALLEVAEALE